MLDAAVGRLTLNEEYGRVTLADAAAFRTWCNADTQAKALARIHPDALPEPGAAREHTLAELRTARPYAILYTDPTPGGYVRTADAVDGDGTFHTRDSGRITVRFEQDVPDNKVHDMQAQMRVAKNSIGQIIDDMVGLAGRGPYLTIREYQVVGPFRSPVEMKPTQGDFIWWELLLQWGLIA